MATGGCEGRGDVPGWNEAGRRRGGSGDGDMESGGWSREGRIKEWTDSLRRQRTRNKMPEDKGHKDEKQDSEAQENVGGGIGRGREGDLAPLQKIIPRAMMEVGSFVLCGAAVRVAARTAGAWHQASRPSPFLGLTGAHLDGSPLEPTLVEHRGGGGPCLVEHCTVPDCQYAAGGGSAPSVQGR